MPSEVPGELICLTDDDADLSIHEKLYKRVRALIVSGALAKGTRFASSRTLALHLGVSRNSVLKAIDRLIADGWLEARRGSGVYVRYASRKLPASRRAVDGAVRSRPFALGTKPLDLFPYQIWNRLQSRRWKHIAEFEPAKSQPLGVANLREAIAAHSALMRGFDYEPDQVVITTSVPVAVDLAARALGLSHCRAWVEDPGYPGATSALNRRNIELVPVAVDASGIDVEDGIRRAPDARFAYVTPACQFPTCAVLSPARRRALIGWAHASGRWILEDDYDWQSCPQSERLPPLAMEDRTNTIYINSLNPLLFPALRVAYLICPASLVDRFSAASSALEESSNVLHQVVLADFIEAGYLGDHIARLAAAYTERRETIYKALARELPGTVETQILQRGTHVPASLCTHDEREFAARCASENITINGAREYCFSKPARNAILLGYSGFSPPIIDKGVRAIARAIRANLQ
ncbi:MAG TPA: PLP-dependent aminotransferase family protein [Rhizomicrobium sp.]|nr:PLP-dependent aminotransferase family protein [Rhizomicrobium sp.]